MPDIPQLVGEDGEFIGVNTRINPDNLPPTYVAMAINRRFEDKNIRNRWAVVRPKWGGLWNTSSFTAYAAANSSSVNTASGLSQVAVNTIVTCNEVSNELVFKNGTRILSKSVDNTNAIFSTSAYSFTNPNPQTFKYYSSTTGITDIVAMLKYRDQTTGKQGLIVASNVSRSDGGQGRVFLIRPNQSHLEIPMNGHDFYDDVRLIQCGDSVVMLRPGPARYYFDGGDVNATTETITLNTTPDLQTGDRVTVQSTGSNQKPLWIGTTSAGEGFGLYVNVLNNAVTLHLNKNSALTGVNKLNLASGLTSSNRWYIELENNTTSYDITQGLESYQNDGLPLIMQASYSSGSQVQAIEKGFDRVPFAKSIVAADTTADTITVPNHNFVPGDQVTISNCTVDGPGAVHLDGIYYVYPVDENTLRLFQGDTEETDSLNDAERATAVANLASGTPPTGIATFTVLNQGKGYLSAPDVTFSIGAATATSTISEGKVTAVNVANPGSYSSAPTVTIEMPTTLVDITGTGTGTIAKSSASGANIPAGRDGLYFQNRLLMIYGNDFLAVSDVLDPLHYSKVINDFKLNTGANDRVITVAAFNNTTLVVFKQRSVLAIENVYGDLSAVRLTEVTREFGCVAPNSVVNTGSDLIFLSQRGIISLRQTEFGISQSMIMPLSDPIQNLVDDIDEVNWSKSCAAYFDNRYLLAHPTEGGDGTNDRLLVYNFINQAWEGYWNGTLINPRFFERVIVAGTERLVFADESGFIHTFHKDGLFDQTASGTVHQIETRIEFRGYQANAIEHKQWTDLHLELRNWDTRYDVSVMFDGVDEELVLSTDTTKDRTVYYKYGQSAYSTTNSGDNFKAPYRQDYSTLPVLQCGNNGWAAGLHQQYTHKARLKGHASAIQPVLTTDRGSLIVSNCKVVGIPFRLYGKNDV